MGIPTNRCFSFWRRFLVSFFFSMGFALKPARAPWAWPGMAHSDWPGLGHSPAREARGRGQCRTCPTGGLTMREGLVPKGEVGAVTGTGS